MRNELELSLDNILSQRDQKIGTNPLVKFCAVILISIFLFGTSDIFKLYCIVIVIILLYSFGGLPLDVAKPRYKMIIVFSLTIFIVQILFVHKGALLFYLIPIISDNIGPFFPIYEQGIYQGLILIGRFWGVISISWVFINSTNPFEFAQSLTSIGIPYRFAYSLSLALRFAPVFNRETNIIQNAQQARGLNVNPSNIKGIINLLRYTLIPMISSTLLRIKDITISMDGRAFGSYTTRSYIKEIPFTSMDWFKLIIIISVLIVFNLI